MVALSPSLTLWVLLPAPVVAIVVFVFGKTIQRSLRADSGSAGDADSPRARKFVRRAGGGVPTRRKNAEMRGFDEPNREYVAPQHQTDPDVELVHAVAAGAGLVRHS